MEKLKESFLRPEEYTQNRIARWEDIGQGKTVQGKGSAGYHRRLQELFQYHIAPGQRVIELGCGTGDLLNSVKPSYGFGVDFSEHMIARAKERYPHLNFACGDAMSFVPDQPFDVVILSDIVNDVWDIQTMLEKVRCYSHAGTRVILNFYSRLWTPILKAAEMLNLAQKPLDQNWITREDITNLLYLSGFEVVRASKEVLFPVPIPLVQEFMNKFLVRFWPFDHMALANLVIARPVFHPEEMGNQLPSVTVVVPARNEAGNIKQIFERLPMMGKFTELIFVEGNSSDDTYAEIERQMPLHPEVDCRLFKQTGKGKGDAVRLGFQKAKGDILMILDADLTVPPEYLPRFYQALANGKGEFINGVRLVYPMEKQAMRLANFLGNKFFSMAFTWLLGQPIKDTLCGTKVLYKEDYERIAANRSYFGDFDPFGDFDLLFGAAKLNMRIVDVPIRYQERKYGTTNIQRWKHGWLLLKMVLFAAFRLKFT